MISSYMFSEQMKHFTDLFKQARSKKKLEQCLLYINDAVIFYVICITRRRLRWNLYTTWLLFQTEGNYCNTPKVHYQIEKCYSVFPEEVLCPAKHFDCYFEPSQSSPVNYSVKYIFHKNAKMFLALRLDMS